MFTSRVSKGLSSGVMALLSETGVAVTEGVYVAAFAAAGALAALAAPLRRRKGGRGRP